MRRRGQVRPPAGWSCLYRVAAESFVRAPFAGRCLAPFGPDDASSATITRRSYPSGGTNSWISTPWRRNQLLSRIAARHRSSSPASRHSITSPPQLPNRALSTNEGSSAEPGQGASGAACADVGCRVSEPERGLPLVMGRDQRLGAVQQPHAAAPERGDLDHSRFDAVKCQHHVKARERNVAGPEPATRLGRAKQLRSDPNCRQPSASGRFDGSGFHATTATIPFVAVTGTSLHAPRLRHIGVNWRVACGICRSAPRQSRSAGRVSASEQHACLLEVQSLRGRIHRSVKAAVVVQRHGLGHPGGGIAATDVHRDARPRSPRLLRRRQPRELPERWRSRAFEPQGKLHCLIVACPSRARAARLRRRDRVDDILHAGAVGKRAQQPQSLVNQHAELTGVVREAQAGDAARPVDIQADLARTNSQKLTPQPLSPLRRVVGGPERCRVGRHASIIAPQTGGHIGRPCGQPRGSLRISRRAGCRVTAMSPMPFARILVGYVPTEQGADARALGVDLAAACGADLLLVSVVSAVWIEHIGEQTGPAVVHSGGRERAASALMEAAGELTGHAWDRPRGATVGGFELAGARAARHRRRRASGPDRRRLLAPRAGRSSDARLGRRTAAQRCALRGRDRAPRVRHPRPPPGRPYRNRLRRLAGGAACAERSSRAGQPYRRRAACA